MMGFKSDKDREAYANKLRAANFTEDEINQDIQAIDAEKPVAAPVAPPQPQPSAKAGGGGSLMTQPEVAPVPMAPAPASEPVSALKDLGTARTEQGMDLTGQIKSDVGQILDTTTGKVAAGLAGAYGLYKGGKLLSKMFGDTPQKPLDLGEPKMGEGPVQAAPLPDNKLPEAAQFDEAKWRASLPPEDQAMLAKSDAARASKATEAAKIQAAMPAAEPPNFLLKQTAAPVEPVIPTLVEAPAPAPAPAPAASQPSAKVAAPPPQLESKLGKPDLVTGTGMPAYQGQGEGTKIIHKKGEISSLKDIPKGYVFVPGGQNMDIVRNAVGQETYTGQLKQTGGYPASPQAAYEQSRDINKSLGRLPYAEAKASGQTMFEPTPSITQKVGGLKTVKVAGTTGALILATDLANAAVTGQSPLASTTQGFTSALKSGDYGMAASHAAELLNLHPLGMLANALYGTSPEELQTLRNAQQARTVGAGRGIAPPSAYQR